MKIRNGFVSNSSSSSFIMIGVDVAKINNFKERKVGNRMIESLYIESDIDELVGFVLAHYSDEDYLEANNFPIGEISKLSNDLAKELNVDVSEVKLYFGTRPS